MLQTEINVELDHAILRTLFYFDMFDYPLTESEVCMFVGLTEITGEDVSTSLQQLELEGKVFRHGNFLSLKNNTADVQRRIKGNACAEESLPRALQVARTISKFPFVRAVMASGSLSKGYMDATSDLDFFVVCERNRLWVSRMLLVIYKRLLLSNSHKFFCINYYIDTDHLEIEEKNLFTATELVTMIPLYNFDLYEKVRKANEWTRDFYPNAQPRPDKTIKCKPAVRLLFERLMNPVAFLLNNLFMRMTLRRWRKLHGHEMPDEQFAIAFKSKSYVAKNHPRNFQNKVLERYANGLKRFAHEHNFEWHG